MDLKIRNKVSTIIWQEWNDKKSDANNIPYSNNNNSNDNYNKASASLFETFTTRNDMNIEIESQEGQCVKLFYFSVESISEIFSGLIICSKHDTNREFCERIIIS